MPLDDPETVRLYLHFIHTNDTHASVTDTSPGVFKLQVEEKYMESAKINVLAEKLQDTQTKNVLIVRVLKTRMKHDDNHDCCLPSTSIIEVVYQGTPEGNKMRQMLVDTWTTVHPEHVLDHCKTLPKGFLGDLAVRFRSMMPTPKKNTAAENGAEFYFEKTRVAAGVMR